jgi:hypothetical protein
VCGDNCDASPAQAFSKTSLTGADLCHHNQTESWTATDNSGNDVVYTRVVTHRDSTPPTYTGPLPEANLVVDCTIPPGVPLPLDDAADDCAANAQLTSTVSDAQGATNLGSFAMLRTFTIADACDNKWQFVQTITVTDLVAPVFDGPEPSSEIVNVSCPLPDVNFATASDACGATTVTCWEYELRETAPSCLRVTTQTCRAQDAAGNTASRMRRFRTLDVDPPVLALPLPRSTLTEVPIGPLWHVSDATATDSCGHAALLMTETKINEVSCSQFDLVYQWVATDDCGLTATDAYTVQVYDVTPPTLSELPQDVTAECDQVPKLCDMKAHEPCGADQAVTPTISSLTDDQGVTIGVVRHWHARDASLNSVDHFQTVSLVDTTPPVWSSSIPADQTLECGCVEPGAPVLHALDNCGEATVSFSDSGLLETDAACAWAGVDWNCDEEGSAARVRTWAAQDHRGNPATTLTQTVRYHDSLPPKIVGLPAANEWSGNCRHVPALTATAEDMCDPQPSLANPNGSSTVTQQTCPHTYTEVRTWEAVDAAGNIGSRSITLHISDDAAPTRATASLCLAPHSSNFAAFPAASQRGLVQPEDDCSSATGLTVTPLSCYVQGVISGDDWSSDCYYHADTDTLYVRASPGTQTEGREYVVSLRVTDECQRSTTGNLKVWVPPTLEHVFTHHYAEYGHGEDCIVAGTTAPPAFSPS